MINLKNVSKGYGANAIFVDLTLDFNAGINKVQGKNGAGKSTLLKLICGVESVDGGELTVPPNATFASCADWCSPPDNFTPQQILLFESQYQTFTKDKYHKLCNQLEITQNAESPFSTLSSGTKNKFNLARCLSKQTSHYLLDEPFNFLDEASKQIIANEILGLAEQTVIVVDHSDYLEIEQRVYL